MVNFLRLRSRITHRLFLNSGTPEVFVRHFWNQFIRRTVPWLAGGERIASPFSICLPPPDDQDAPCPPWIGPGRTIPRTFAMTNVRRIFSRFQAAASSCIAARLSDLEHTSAIRPRPTKHACPYNRLRSSMEGPPTPQRFNPCGPGDPKKIKHAISSACPAPSSDQPRPDLFIHVFERIDARHLSHSMRCGRPSRALPIGHIGVEPVPESALSRRHLATKCRWETSIPILAVPIFGRRVPIIEFFGSRGSGLPDLHLR